MSPRVALFAASEQARRSAHCHRAPVVKGFRIFGSLVSNVKRRIGNARPGNHIARKMPPFRYGLRAKLLLLSVVLVVVSGVSLAALTFSTARRALERAVGRQLTEVAHGIAEAISEKLLEEQKNLRSWARQDLMREVIIGDLDKNISRFLASLKNEEPAYVDLLCVDASGGVIAATDPKLVGLDVSRRSWFDAVLSGRHVLRGPRLSPIHNRRVLEIASPIRRPEDRDEVIGALLLLYDWSESGLLGDRTRRTLAVLGTELDVVVLDRHGTVIGGAWDDRLKLELGQNLRKQGWRMADRVLSGRARWGFGEEPQAEALIGYAPMDELRFGWRVMVLQPLSDALDPVYQMQRRWLFVLAAVLMIALAVAAIVADRMIRPLREVTRATAEISRYGVPAGPVPVSSRDEIGELATAFNAMAANLDRAQEDLMAAAKFAFVGEVAAEIAHEVRTPLGVMRASAQLLARSLDPASQERELVAMMIAEADRLERVVAGLLELARPHEPRIEKTQLAEVLARAAELVQAPANAKGIALRCELAPGYPLVFCDPDQIYQVALNLLMNAMQSLDRGGTVVVRTLPFATGRLGFEVSDDGPGIPADIRDRIFLPFVTGREGGTGLGLALVDRMVRANRGSVDLESAKGNGATFRVTLPAAEE
jgi:signal transduction histidine kinase